MKYGLNARNQTSIGSIWDQLVYFPACREKKTDERKKWEIIRKTINHFAKLSQEFEQKKKYIQHTQIGRGGCSNRGLMDEINFVCTTKCHSKKLIFPFSFHRFLSHFPYSNASHAFAYFAVSTGLKVTATERFNKNKMKFYI